MNGVLKSITYVSRARAGLTDGDVFEIYQRAISTNALEGITGLLVYDGSVFVQIVEGGEDALTELFGRLTHDDRHQAIHVMDERIIEERSFGTWSMKLLRIDRAHMTGVALAEQLMGPGVRPEIRAMLLKVINQMDDLAQP